MKLQLIAAAVFLTMGCSKMATQRSVIAWGKSVPMAAWADNPQYEAEFVRLELPEPQEVTLVLGNGDTSLGQNTLPSLLAMNWTISWGVDATSTSFFLQEASVRGTTFHVLAKSLTLRGKMGAWWGGPGLPAPGSNPPGRIVAYAALGQPLVQEVSTIPLGMRSWFGSAGLPPVIGPDLTINLAPYAHEVRIYNQGDAASLGASVNYSCNGPDATPATPLSAFSEWQLIPPIATRMHISAPPGSDPIHCYVVQRIKL